MMRIPLTQLYVDRNAVWQTVLTLTTLHTAVYIVTGLNLFPPIPWGAALKAAVELIFTNLVCCLAIMCCYCTLIVDLFMIYTLIYAKAFITDRLGIGHPLNLGALVLMGVVIADMLPYLPVSTTTLGCVAAVLLYAGIHDLANDFGRMMHQVNMLVYQHHNNEMNRNFAAIQNRMNGFFVAIQNQVNGIFAGNQVARAA